MGSLRFVNSKTITDGNMSGAINGVEIDISYAVYVNGQAFWSGTTPVGSVQFQVSNDGGVTWTSLTPTVAVSGNTGSVVLNPQNGLLGYEKVRGIYNFTSGTGTLQFYISGKSG